MTRLERSDWAHLLPHAGAMCLLDEVDAWSVTTIHAGSIARPGHPLRNGAGLHAVYLAEYGAQAMALHGALLARAGGDEAVRPGMLVSLRDVRLEAAFVDTGKGRLDVHAERLYADASGTQYVFRIEQAGCVLASGRAAAIYG